MTYTFIVERCSDLPVEQCCRVMKVWRCAFYGWQHRQTNPTAKMLADDELSELIVKIHDESRGTYGAARVTAELRLGLRRTVNRKRVERLMENVACRASAGGDAQSAAPVDDRRTRGRTISCTAGSVPTAPTGCGCRTSPSIGVLKLRGTSR
jgi:HTH-like domain